MSLTTAPASPVKDAVTPPSPPTARYGRRYRVLMIAPTSFFADYGCHVRILEEARVLQKLGHTVTIVTYNSGSDVAGLTIERTMPIPWWRNAVVGSSPHKVAYDILLSLKVLQVARRFRPHVVHGHLHEGALLGWPPSLLRRVPLVFDFQGSLTSEMVDHGFLQRDGILYPPMRRLEEFIDRLPGAIITSSQHAADLCINEYGCRPDVLHPVPDAVNADVFRPGLLTTDERMARRQELGIPSDRQVVVYLGLLAAYQGTDLLVRAAARVLADRPNVHFLIMGYPGRHRYQRLAERLGIADHVTLTGRIPYPEAPEALALGDVAVAPKLSATEGSGKLLNYMAMGLPTVAFDTPVSREYLAEHGVYAPRGDVDGLARSVSELLGDAECAGARGAKLRERAIAYYSWDDAGQRLIDIYESVIETVGGYASRNVASPTRS